MGGIDDGKKDSLWKDFKRGPPCGYLDGLELNSIAVPSRAGLASKKRKTYSHLLSGRMAKATTPVRLTFPPAPASLFDNAPSSRHKIRGPELSVPYHHLTVLESSDMLLVCKRKLLRPTDPGPVRVVERCGDLSLYLERPLLLTHSTTIAAAPARSTLRPVAA